MAAHPFPARPAAAADIPGRSRRRAFALILIALASVLGPTPASGEGLNDWGGKTAAPGEVWVVPQGVLSLSSGAPQIYYLQLQFGLADKIDLIATPTFPIADSTFGEPWLDAFARYRLGDAFSLGLGASVALGFEDAPSVIVAAFQTLQLNGDVLWITWNLTAWVPPAAPDTAALFGVGVLNRSFTDLIGGYVEVDVTAGIDALADTVVQFGGGVLLSFGDVDQLDFGVLIPVKPLVGDGSPPMISAWYAHGFGVE